MNNNKERQEKPILLQKLMELLRQHQSIFKQERIYHRVVGLVLAELFAFGRHTVTQLLLVLGITDDDWSAWYRLFSHQRFQEKKAARVVLGAVLAEIPAGQPFVTGFDGFQVPRTSRKMPGSSWLKALGTAPFKPGLHRAQRFVEGSWLTPLEQGYSRAIPIRCLPAFTAKAVASPAPYCKEWEAGGRYLSWLRREMDQLGRAEQRILALADGSFDRIGMWEVLAERVDLVVRTARNRALFQLPEQTIGPGRPAKYGAKAPAPHYWLRQRKEFKIKKVLVRGRERRMRYRVKGPFVRDGLPDIPVFLLVIGGGKRPSGSRRKQYKPCFFLVSAVQKDGQWQLPLPLIDLLAWLWQRWELEVAHREMKSALGLGEKQCWNAHASILAVQWSAWVYAILVLAGYQAWGLFGGMQPPGRWRFHSQRWSFNTLWRGYRASFWQQSDFRASWTPTRDNWLKKEPFFAALNNSVIAASRA